MSRMPTPKERYKLNLEESSFFPLSLVATCVNYLEIPSAVTSQAFKELGS